MKLLCYKVLYEISNSPFLDVKVPSHLDGLGFV